MMGHCRLTPMLGLLIVTAMPLAITAEERGRATDLMATAHQSRAVWEEFPGFEADLTVSADEWSQQGTIRVGSDFEYDLSLDQADSQSWVDAKLRSLISHRRPRESAEAEVSFADDVTDHVNGRLVVRDDGSARFRIQDGVLREIIRQSESSWLEISTLKVLRTDDGRYLPEVTSVTYRDPDTGRIESNRTNHFAWTKIGNFDLPARALTVEVGANGERSVRELVLSNHRLLTSTDDKLPRSVLHKPLPEALTSFGAAVQDGYLYVFSGHSGDAHGAGRDLLADHFRRIKVEDPDAEWEELAKHEPAQSTALVSDGEFLYRIGGLSFLNSGVDSETNFNSTAHFARYDVAKNTWTDLTPLPEPRSSLDAAILGRSIYVAGGWNLQGDSSQEAPWHDDLLKFDLDDPEAGWQSLEGPGYVTRALSVAAHDGKLYVLGGIQERQITRKVSIYDPQTNSWSEGPELKPDSSVAGFATSAFATGGHLYCTGSSGVVYRLNNDGTDWEIADRLLFPRMFLRLVPLGNDRLVALGGTSGGGRVPVVESVRVGGTSYGDAKSARWSLSFDGRAKHSQILVLDGMQLYAFGGNASRQPHDFSEEAFVDEAFVFDIPRQSVEQLPSLPRALQSGSGVAKSQTSEHQTIVITGGLGFTEDGFSALSEILEFDPGAKTWSTAPVSLPQPRGMSAATIHDDALWVFGGSGAGHARGMRASILHWWGDSSPIAPLAGVSVPTPRRSLGAAVIGNECFLVGGLTESGIAENVDVFHFEDRTWRQAAAPHEPRVFPSFVTANDKLYLFGGFTRTDGHFAPATTLEVYDPEQDQWQIAESQPEDVDPSMSMLNLNDRLLFYGIDKAVDGQANFVLFDPEPMAEPEVVAGMSFRSGGGRDGSAARDARMLMRRDSDKDGRLSSDELGPRMASFFNRADGDADQRLTLAEVTSALEADADSDVKPPAEKQNEPAEEPTNKPAKDDAPKASATADSAD